jgi:hypothetical protein
MNGLISRLGWIGALGLGWLCASGVAEAWGYPPVKVDTVIRFQFDIKVTPAYGLPTAPWYTYFPADPRLLASPQLSPYPPWPAQFPPAGPPSDALKGAQPMRGPNVPYGPMQTQWSTPFAYGSNLQPVGYLPVSAPSYWYQNR